LGDLSGVLLFRTDERPRLAEAHRLRRAVNTGADVRPMRLFHASITYLAVLFVVLAISAAM